MMTVFEKAEKLDSILEEYKKLSKYRSNLYNIVIYNANPSIYESYKTPAGHTTREFIKSISVEEIRKIKEEIDRVDSIISFIDSVVNDLEIVKKSKI